MTITTGPAHDTHISADAAPPRRADRDDTAAPDAPSADPEDASAEDWAQADGARPTLPDETADGLDDMDEEVRRQAEDRP